MKAGEYRADRLLPGDVTEHGVVLDNVGDRGCCVVTFRRPDASHHVVIETDRSAKYPVTGHVEV